MRKTPGENEIIRVKRPKRAKLTEEEILKRMASFDERKEQIIAAVRKGKG
jgi:hypothetical protein